ncbi:MAG: DUF1611 domain-containing protein [Fimbriimonadaceae bacterium]
MLDRRDPLAIYMEGQLEGNIGKMGIGILRYSPNPVACVIDSTTAGRNAADVTGVGRSCPIVAGVPEAMALGAKVFVLGIAPPGGLIPPEWYPAIDAAWAAGLSVVNGLHDLLGQRYSKPTRPGQWIWDIRIEPEGLGVGGGLVANLTNKRVLMIGTDMAVGKMTAGLEIYRKARAQGVKAEFVATGQIGITITGRGVPLDAIRIDYASGAVEAEVMRVADADLVIVEGQGALIHPGSSANLPLLRGTCPTHLVLCARAGQTHLARIPNIAIPPLGDYIRLYEELAEACNTFPRPHTVGVCLNTFGLPQAEAEHAIAELEATVNLPVVDPVRGGVERIIEALEFH